MARHRTPTPPPEGAPAHRPVRRRLPALVLAVPIATVGWPLDHIRMPANRPRGASHRQRTASAGPPGRPPEGASPQADPRSWHPPSRPQRPGAPPAPDSLRIFIHYPARRRCRARHPARRVPAGPPLRRRRYPPGRVRDRSPGRALLLRRRWTAKPPPGRCDQRLLRQPDALRGSRFQPRLIQATARRCRGLALRQQAGKAAGPPANPPRPAP